MLKDYIVTDTTSFDVETEALDKIWENKADFNDKITSLTAAASNLNKVVKVGETSQFKPAIGQVFKSFKSCHEVYKED